MSEPCDHEWTESYYGHDCKKCDTFVPHGCGPWDEPPYPYDDWNENEDWDEEWFDCGWVRGQGCTMAGSEICDFDCPHRDDFLKGMRLTQARLAKRAKEKR